MTVLTPIVVWLNGLANAGGSVLLQPIAVLPGWLSATLVAAVTAAIALFAFKYTSKQEAVKRTRREIQANVLALALFGDSAVVSLKTQGRILAGAARLLALAVIPMLVMAIPMGLLAGQLSLWYQAHPLAVGEEAVVTVHLGGRPDEDLHGVGLAGDPAIESIAGPVRVANKQMICWNVQARKPGYHQLTFEVNGQSFVKELAVGDGFMRVSPRRPAWSCSDVARHPSETPFSVHSEVQAIEIAYPDRHSWTAGTNCWILYWFAASLVFAFLLRPLLRVNL